MASKFLLAWSGELKPHLGESSPLSRSLYKTRVFPFTQGICKHLPPQTLQLLNFKSSFTGKDGKTYTLRLAQEGDRPFLAKVLHSYGHSPTNYPDLEFFPEDKLPIILQNMTHCFEHRYFVTYLIFTHEGALERPVGFLQMDPYDFSVIYKNFIEVLFPQWNIFLDRPIPIDWLTTITPLDAITAWLEAHVSHNDLHNYINTLKPPVGEFEQWLQNWKQYILDSFCSFYALKEDLGGHLYAANVSYGILPEYQRKGLALQAWQNIFGRLKYSCIHVLFSDRIASKNIPSTHLLQKLNFEISAFYNIYYSQHYHTSKHPNGLFIEPCVALVKYLTNY